MSATTTPPPDPAGSVAPKNGRQSVAMPTAHRARDEKRLLRASIQAICTAVDKVST